MSLTKIISGCQTGADRAGLVAAKDMGYLTGGTVTKGNRTDEGPRPDLITLYGLTESPYHGYPPRTVANVREADGTVLFGNMGSPGCGLTLDSCIKYGKVYIVNPTPQALKAWIVRRGITVLNVAGNRERTNPGIYTRTYNTLIEALR